MSHPIIVSANAQMRHEALMQAAEKSRRLKRLPGGRRGLHIRFLSGLAKALIGLGGSASSQRSASTKAVA